MGVIDYEQFSRRFNRDLIYFVRRTFAVIQRDSILCFHDCIHTFPFCWLWFEMNCHFEAYLPALFR